MPLVFTGVCLATIAAVAGAWLYSKARNAEGTAPVLEQSDLAPYTIVVAGIDSLTDGAGGTDWRRYFRQAALPQIGNGGSGWASFSPRGAEDHGAKFDTQGFEFFDLTTPAGALSLDGEGMIGSGTAKFTWDEPTPWAKARVFYRRQALGGALQCYGGDLVMTAGEGLGWFDIERIGPLYCETSGPVILYGVLFLSGKRGLVMVNMARGGRKLADVAAQDGAARAEWFAALDPDVLMLNAGANDWRNDTPEAHRDGISLIAGDALAGAPAMRVYLIQHNGFGGDDQVSGTERYLANMNVEIELAKEMGFEVIRVSDELGSYAEAVTSGLIMDQIHPSDAGNRKLGPFFAERVFGEDR